MNVSNRLVWPVASPWALRRRGTATAYLSSRQRALLWIAHKTLPRGPRTLEELARTAGVTSRGQVSRELRRLRQLELIGYIARKGRNGQHFIWIPTASRKLRAALSDKRLPRPNDSLSTPFGGFVSRIGVERAELSRRRPPGAGGPAARDGPRRGRNPPRVLYARCPIGHTARLPRGPWTRARGGQLLRAEWNGICRQCGDRPVREILELELIPIPARPRSAEELADPAVLERRRRLALEALADPSTPLEVAERLRRDYLDEPPANEPGHLSDELERLKRRR